MVCDEEEAVKLRSFGREPRRLRNRDMVVLSGEKTGDVEDRDLELFDVG